MKVGQVEKSSEVSGVLRWSVVHEQFLPFPLGYQSPHAPRTPLALHEFKAPDVK